MSYTIAIRDAIAHTFTPVQGIPMTLSRGQAETLAQKARDNGFDVVALNTQAA